MGYTERIVLKIEFSRITVKVKYESQADEDGLWYKVEYESQADIKIYFVEYESQAELKIYFVEYESQAGWQNKKKQHLLL